MEWGAVSPRWQYWSWIKSLTGFVRAKFFSCYTKTIQLIIRDQYRHLVVMAPHCKSDPLAQQVSSVARLETSRQPNTLLHKWSFSDSFKKQNLPNILLKRPNYYSPKKIQGKVKLLMMTLKLSPTINLGSSCSTAVERMTHDQEIQGLNAARCLDYFNHLFLSLISQWCVPMQSP